MSEKLKRALAGIAALAALALGGAAIANATTGSSSSGPDHLAAEAEGAAEIGGAPDATEAEGGDQGEAVSGADAARARAAAEQATQPDGEQ